jgi:G3E family GTPase
VVETNYGRVPYDRILDTGRFDFEKAQQHPLWFRELYGFANHVPESDEFGIRSFVYRARRPFVPQKFHEFLQEIWPGVIRAKGHFWIATRAEWVGEMSQAGAIVKTEAMGHWWAAIPRPRWSNDPGFQSYIKKNWNDLYGDRRQELVFIGAGMDEAAICARLNACLVAGRPGMDEAAWSKLPDPFPVWRRGDEAA